MSFLPRHLFAEFNRGIKRARDAYRADEAHREARCPRCGEPGGGERGRWCSPCRKAAKG